MTSDEITEFVLAHGSEKRDTIRSVITKRAVRELKPGMFVNIGIGIPEGDMPHIFDRFYRVDKARSREHGGSGLGLSIVHDAVAECGGSIAVEPNSPRGTRFIVQFPKYAKEGGL